MSILESLYVSGRVVYFILVPVLREAAAVFLAVAISKDCKARGNGSGALWGLFTLLVPAVAGIIYFIYSRLIVKREAESPDGRKKVKASYQCTAAAVVIYLLSLVLAVTAIVVSTVSGIAAM